jgi:hypothetical protein
MKHLTRIIATLAVSQRCTRPLETAVDTLLALTIGR